MAKTRFHITIMRTLFIILSAVISLNSFALQVGAERYEHYLPLLKKQRVALVVNQSAYTRDGHLLDSLLAKGVKVSKVFAPEHGFRGDHDAGAYVASDQDIKTGIPIISLYGKNKRPKAEQLEDVDVIIFDIQDVGVRFYTYISTMHYMMEVAAKYQKTFIVLDRPNPNIAYVDGPVLEPEFTSFVGIHPIPILHGLTVGELAKMIVGEGWLKENKSLDLKVIPVNGYNASMRYDLPIKPSPNLPNAQAIALYPSLCFFEATPISVGRGTELPFQVYGHAILKLGDFGFTPKSIVGAAVNPKFKNQRVFGVNLTEQETNGLDLKWLIHAYQEFSSRNIPFFTHVSFMDKLAGTDKLRLAIESGDTQQVIRQRWQRPLQDYLRRRQPYLLYKR